MDHAQLATLIALIVFSIISIRFIWIMLHGGFNPPLKLPPKAKGSVQQLDASLAKFTQAVVGQKLPVHTASTKAMMVDALPYLTVDELIAIKDGYYTGNDLQVLLEFAISRGIKYR